MVNKIHHFSLRNSVPIDLKTMGNISSVDSETDARRDNYYVFYIKKIYNSQGFFVLPTIVKTFIE